MALTSMLPTRRDAAAEARNRYNDVNRFMRGARRYSSRVGGTASQLRRYGSQAMNDYNASFRPFINRLPQKASIPLQQYIDEAAQTAQQQNEIALGNYQRGLERMGINPNSGRWLATMGDLNTQAALNKTDAINNARLTGRRENWGRETQAAQIGTMLANDARQDVRAAGNLNSTAAQLQSGLAGQSEGLSNSAAEYAATNDITAALDRIFGASTQPTGPQQQENDRLRGIRRGVLTGIRY